MADNETAIYDAKTLGTPKMIVLGLQHMFAMFGATVLVPLITGLSVSTTLLFAGHGTLLFHLITKRKVPAFLGSSFAFLGGYAAIAPLDGDGIHTQAQLLPYACLGVACAGLVYLILAGFIKAYGVSKVMKYFPPVVTGPIIIAIGLGLSGSAVSNCKTDWLVAFVALATIIIFNIWGRGMLKIIPIILGVVVSYIVALIRGGVDFTAMKEAAWIGFPIHWESTVFGGVYAGNTSLIISSIIAITPIALATMMEHIGDISAISATVGRNYLADPGLHRTLTGDGLATTLASLFGAPANTTYGENTGVLALTKVYDPRVIRIAAGFAIFFSFSPKFAAFINSIPAATIGGISFVLYGMISAAGVRNLVDSHVDFAKSRNLIIAAVILVASLDMTDGLSFHIGKVAITLSALAVGSLAGILLNAILPGKDYVFDANPTEEGTGANMSSSPNAVMSIKRRQAEKEAKDHMKAAQEHLKAAREASKAAAEAADAMETSAVEAADTVAEAAADAVEDAVK
ncbi:MAG: uracil-xanthine permease [Clostridia bacterium]|nr:uracil-xanthine permease [Clostridia bacterium]